VKRRVVITGLGVVAPNGIGKKKFWENLTKGKSAIRKIESFDVSKYPSQIGGEVKEFKPEEYMDSKLVNRTGRFTQFAIASAKIAVEDSQLQIKKIEPFRIGACFGTSIGGGGDVFEKGHLHFLSNGIKKVRTAIDQESSPHASTGHVSIELGIKGPTSTIASSCCTGLDVINWGVSKIRLDDLDIAIVGGIESPFSPFVFSTFCANRVLSRRNNEPQKASRPYELNRDGFVASEGGGAIILEELEHALDRNANIYAEVLSYANLSGGSDMSRCFLDGETLAKAIEIALIRAKLKKTDIDYINGHGNSMKNYDLCETNAIKNAFGEIAYNIPISSIKSMIGQSFAVSGAFQIASSCLTIKESIVPPTINYEQPDPQCNLDYVPNQARLKRVNNILINAHGIGETYSVLIIGKYSSTV